MSDTQKNTPAERLAEVRHRLIEASIVHIPFDGWSDTLLRRAAETAGIDAFTAKRTFPGGGKDMAMAFAEHLHQLMLRELASVDPSSMKIRERIRFALETRFRTSYPYREAIRRLLAFFALPTHAHLALQTVYRTVDDIWHWAGDRSTDYNFYTKRTLLAGVYSSTLLYWLEDESDGFVKTREFLSRRIDDVMQIQKLRGRVERAVAGWLPPLPFDRRA